MAENLFGELKRRKVFKVGAAYLVVAWLAVQAASIGFPAFEAPAWALRVFILVSLLGFPIALVMAWVFESTPEGVQFDPVRSGTKRVVATAVVLSALALAWYFKGQPAYRADEAPAAAAKPTAATAAAPAVSAQSIAVLPFENLSDAKGNEYFVSGMQDMILTSLYKLRDLKVISRTSTEKYASRPDNLRQVAGELGVAYILEGSVQRQGDRVLINLQLIDARSDTHVWAEIFDRKVEDVFSVEKEVAGLVADALRTTLLPAAREGLGAAPTANPAAYDLYLRGQYEYRRYGMSTAGNQSQALRQAATLFEQATAADPGFALAYAWFSRAQALRYWEARLDKAERQALADGALRAARKAKELAPDLPDADLALAEYQYRIELDYTGALASFDTVLARQPGLLDALTYRAFTLRRLGRYDEAIASLSASMEADPRDSFPVTERGLTHWFAGNLRQAEADFRRALSLNPEDEQAAARLSRLLLFRDGDIAAASKALGEDETTNVDERIFLLVDQRKYDEALAVLDRAEAAGLLGESSAEQRASVLVLAGRNDEARALLQGRIAKLRAAVAALPANTGSGQGERFVLARAEWVLGNKDAALALVAQALAQLPVEKDPANGARNLGRAAANYAAFGRLDLALPLLARLRALKGTDIETSAAILRLDPDFDSVRADPRFQQEIALFAAKQAKEWR
jgi:TolB-like protein/Tfp pilus assembly protein PilF